MLAYITIGATDMEKSKAFYDKVLETVGWKRHADYGVACAYSLGGGGEGQSVWVTQPYDKNPASVGNGMMAAFAAASHDAVRAFHEAALAAGGSDEGLPGPRPQYSDTWYGAYVRDPMGNKLAVACF